MRLSSRGRSSKSKQTLPDDLRRAGSKSGQGRTSLVQHAHTVVSTSIFNVVASSSFVADALIVVPAYSTVMVEDLSSRSLNVRGIQVRSPCLRRTLPPSKVMLPPTFCACPPLAAGAAAGDPRPSMAVSWWVPARAHQTLAGYHSAAGSLMTVAGTGMSRLGRQCGSAWWRSEE